tara:strand:+ start:390 stop:1073 length:684 start_codon:yes stop_codon:yes gene_type:complete
MNFLLVLKKILTIYISITFLEWFIHNKMMHGDPEKLIKIPIVGKYLSNTAEEHLSHHKDVNMNMIVEKTDRKEGLFFPWKVTFTMAVAGSVAFYITRVFKEYKYNFLLALVFAIIYAILWNTLHPAMHDFNANIKWSEGMPKFDSINIKNPMYRWLWINHALHHMQKYEKGNYNIILPGFDYLANTYYSRCYNNNKYCKDNKQDRRVCKKSLFINRCLTRKDIIPKQ